MRRRGNARGARRGPGVPLAAFTALAACATLAIAPLAAPVSPADLPPFDARGSGIPARGAELETFIDAVEAAVQEHPGDARLLALLGQCYFRRGSYEWRAFGVRRLRGAIELAPDDAELRLALGYALADQDFTDYAREAMKAAAESAPDRPEPHRELGRSWFRAWRVTRGDEELREVARGHLARAFALEPGHPGGAAMLALLERAKGDPAAADSVLRRCEEQGGDSPDLQFLAGLLAFESERMEDAAARFDRGLALVPAGEREAYDRIELFLAGEQLAELKQATPAQRAEFARRFWQMRDPTPTTEVNERMLEHRTRVFLADAYFGVPRLGLRGWQTARGEAWIRYGQPQAETYTLEAAVEGKFECPTQRWHYATSGGSFTLTFQDRGLNEKFDLPHDTDGSGAVELAAIVQRALPEQRAWKYPGREEPLVVDACRFRGERGGTEVALFFQLPAGEVFRAEKRLAVFDASWRALDRREETVDYAARRRSAKREARPAVDALRCQLPAGAYHLAVDVEDEDQSLLLSWRSQVLLESLRSDSLSASDLLLLESVRPALGGEVFSRGGLALEPRPDRRFEQGEEIHVYLELYGLRASEDDPGSYVIDYRLDSLEKPPERGFFVTRWVRGLFGREPTHGVSYRFERRTQRESVTEHYVLGVSSLPPGGMMLTIGVTDGRTGRQVARSVAFEVTGER